MVILSHVVALLFTHSPRTINSRPPGKTLRREETCLKLCLFVAAIASHNPMGRNNSSVLTVWTTSKQADELQLFLNHRTVDREPSIDFRAVLDWDIIR